MWISIKLVGNQYHKIERKIVNESSYLTKLLILFKTLMNSLHMLSRIYIIFFFTNHLEDMISPLINFFF